MSKPLADVASAFSTREQRPAGFDRQLRQRFNLWSLETGVEVTGVLQAASQQSGLTTDDGGVRIPLHEEQAPEMTGEYLEYYPAAEPPAVRYYEFSSETWETVPVEQFNAIYPAYRIRLWAGGEATERQSETTTEPSTGNAGSPTPAPTTAKAAQTSTPPVTAETLDADEVIQELNRFVEREREAERDDARQRFGRLTPREYQRTAGGIPEIHPAGIDIDEYGQQLVKLRVPEDVIEGPIDITEEFGIYPDSEILIGALGSTSGFPVEAKVIEIEGRQLGVGIYWNRNEESTPESAFDVDSDNRYCVGELHNPVPYDRITEAIDVIAADPHKQGLLTGETPLSFATEEQWDIERARVNDDQRAAAEGALTAEDVFCIHGPPGTGKTRTLLEIIKSASAARQRVLVCAHSNQAVDNLLVGSSTTDSIDENSLHAAVEDGKLSAARVGSNSDNPLVEEQYESADRYQSDVVCSTMSGAHLFGENRFDLAVVDEATQASTAATMLPFSRAETIVLAGDHKQLPPYHSGEQSTTEELEISLFEHFLGVYGDEVVAPLRTQYRMHEDIAEFPSREFYDGQLSHGIANRYRTLGAFSPLAVVDVTGTEQETPGASIYNDAEIDAVLQELGRLRTADVPLDTVGVISPYSGQVSKLRAAIRKEFDTEVAERVAVDTIDSFQGSERDAIIISFVRSNDRNAGGFLKFPVEGPRRLNVALTRAKQRLVVIGDFETLTTPEAGTEPEATAAPVYQRLYSYLQEQSMRDS